MYFIRKTKSRITKNHSNRTYIYRGIKYFVYNSFPYNIEEHHYINISNNIYRIYNSNDSTKGLKKSYKIHEFHLIRISIEGVTRISLRILTYCSRISHVFSSFLTRFSRFLTFNPHVFSRIPHVYPHIFSRFPFCIKNPAKNRNCS